MNSPTNSKTIEEMILFIRGERVLLDKDIAGLFSVTTGNLNKAVKRNSGRFPSDFMFQLTKKETEETSCFQFGILKRGANFKYLPYAFTEQGIAMLSSVLKSKRAVQVNISIMRVFVNIRRVASVNKEMQRSLKRIEEKLSINDRDTKTLLEVIQKPSETRLLIPGKPFSNKKVLRDILNNCEDYIYWVDKYFSKPGLDLLFEAIDLKRIKEVKILMLEEKVDDKFKKMFEDLKKEVKPSGVAVEIGFLEATERHDIHDRWIISKNKVFNVPSTDTVARGQYSETKETKNRPPFEKWWETRIKFC